MRLADGVSVVNEGELHQLGYHCCMVAVFHVAVGTGRVFHWFVALVSVHH
jgi:hypothetical protein